MEDPLIDRRNRFRIGVTITAMSAMAASLAMPLLFDSSPLWWLAIAGLALLSATGIGLLVGARFARVVGGLLFLAGGVLSPISLIQVLSSTGAPESWELGWLLPVANAVATTLLLVWLCFRAIQVLLGTSRRTSVVTTRLVGFVLAVIAANHLWLAAQIGFGWQGSWTVDISTRGTQLIGFPGWQLWHLAMLVTTLVLLAAPRRMFGIAATALMVLCIGMVPLVIVAAVRTGFLQLELLLALSGMMLLPVYLSWWLRDELRGLPGHRA